MEATPHGQSPSRRSGSISCRRRAASADCAGIPLAHRSDRAAHGGRRARRSRAEPVVVLSHRFWQSRLGGGRDVVGKTLRLNGIPFTVAGVAPAGFHGSIDLDGASDLFLTLQGHALVEHDPSMMTDVSNWWVQLLGRTTDQSRAATELTHSMRAFVLETRPSYPQIGELRVEMLPGARGLADSRASLRRPIVLLAALLAVLFVLACTNVANLQFARSLRRRRETATKLALGAPRSRIVRQTLLESILLTGSAAAAALLITPTMSSLMLRLLPARGTALAIDTSVDLRIALFAMLAALIGGIALGILPALRGTGESLAGALRGRGGSQPASRLARMLVVAQIGMSVALLVTAALLVRSVRNIDRIDLGYNPENVLQFRLAPGENGYPAERRSETARRVLETVTAIPGVASVTQSSNGVLTGNSMMTNASVRSVATDGSASTMVSRGYLRVNNVDAAFLETMQIKLLRGRGIISSDGTGAPLVAVIDEAAAKSIFVDAEPLGATFTMAERDYQVVGIVRDAKYTRVRGEEGPVAYTSLAQHPDRVDSLTFDVRTHVTPASVVPSIVEAAHRIDPDLPLFGLESQRALVERSTRQERSFAMLAAAVGMLAMLLACAGLYALLSYLVSGRKVEAGVRMALGAERHHIVRLVMGDSLGLVAAGVALGVPLAILGVRALQEILYEVSPHDPLSVAVAVLLMLGVAGAASAIPAWRAAIRSARCAGSDRM
ncbi:MAG: ABC transporter permease [Thermoanaerobaculia bacterium]